MEVATSTCLRKRYKYLHDSTLYRILIYLFMIREAAKLTLLNLENKIQKIRKQNKIAFVSALVAGILAHIVWITNFYVNNDSISGYYYNATQTDYSYLGRWFAKYIRTC